MDELASRVMWGERAAVAEALNVVEDRRPAVRPRAEALLRAIGAREGGRRVGLTGPPGVGKSTLVSALVKRLRARGTTVGVLAVDPSSPRSGGALLGDRARIDVDPKDAGVFVRSLASAGMLGGLARSVLPGALVLAGAYETVLVETTGVGQSEVDVQHVVDTVVCVVQPGSGDVLQFLKAGIMEVPDVWVVNKMDHGETARRVLRDLTATLGQVRAAGLGGSAWWQGPVVAVSARDGTGLDALVAVLDEHHAGLVAHGELGDRRRRGAVAWGVLAFVRRYGEEGVERVGGLAAVEARVARTLAEGRSVLEV